MASLTGATVVPAGGDLPALRITRNGSQITLAWTTSLTGLVLESSATLATPWQTVTTAPTQSGTSYTVTLPVSGTRNFYRLRRP